MECRWAMAFIVVLKDQWPTQAASKMLMRLRVETVLCWSILTLLYAPSGLFFVVPSFSRPFYKLVSCFTTKRKKKILFAVCLFVF